MGVRSRSALLFVVAVVAACGARTGLLGPSPVDGTSVDVALVVDVVISSDACGPHCSADLHEVLDCHDNVIETCPADQGCDGTGCSPACFAAQAQQTTIGCEYYSFAPDVLAAALLPGSCFAAFVANTWTTPVTLKVDRAGVTFNLADFARVPTGSGSSLTYTPLPGGVLAPGQVAILFLAYDQGKVACPAGVLAAVNSSDPTVHGTGRGSAFHITASAPISAYDIFPYGGGAAAVTGATLLLPTTPFATRFVAVAPYDVDTLVPTATSTLTFVGTQNGTQVVVNPTANIAPGPGVAGGTAGVPVTYTLQAGEELQIAQRDLLGGSLITATQPIAVFAGSTCMNIDVQSGYCDIGHQQLPATPMLGSEYVGVRYRNRFDNTEEIVPWRFMGIVDGTTLTYDPPVSGAPSALMRGQLAQVWASGPFVVRSQDEAHPFYLSAHMTGSLDPHSGGTTGALRGDPEFVNVVPTKQYLASYTFFTDPTYPETNLVVVRPPNGQDVTLDCAGKLGGWQAIGASGYEYTRIDLVRYDFVPQGSCDNGRHVMTSGAPFALTVWGWGSELTQTFTQAVSYAYPAGAGVAPINDAGL